MIDILRSISIRVNNLAKGMLMVAAFTMVSAVFMQVIFRYVLKAPLSWSEELARYTFMWITFLGASVALRQNSLPNITLGLSYFRKKYNLTCIWLLRDCHCYFVIIHRSRHYNRVGGAAR